MAFKKFEDIIAWQRAQELGVSIYKAFGRSKDFGFRDQICRAAVSVSSNIAEGFERGTDKEFIRFLRIASASCAEVRSLLHLAKQLNMDSGKSDELIALSQEVSRIIYGLVKSLTPDA